VSQPLRKDFDAGLFDQVADRLLVELFFGSSDKCVRCEMYGIDTKVKECLVAVAVTGAAKILAIVSSLAETFGFEYPPSIIPMGI